MIVASYFVEMQSETDEVLQLVSWVKNGFTFP